MASMHVSLSDTMKHWVEDQIQSGQYHNASEYVRSLIRKDQEVRQRLLQLRSHLAEGERDLANGDFDTLATKADIRTVFADLRSRNP
ncbi:hypothetical protein MNBD_ALPHA06-1018 [hydrothermal vent metagenome]|uniref:ParD protein (Antitoxin to ParE) n=1 Tax=hydrothermal vent metagenome TaxID=652676 RepID=A0A3B0RA35_9ZZZZ